MTNFDYISEQIKAGKMNADEMEEFIFAGAFKKLDCDCSDCRKKFLESRYVPLIKPCPFCGSDNIILKYDLQCQGYYCYCGGCATESGRRNTKVKAIESWNSIRREKDND